MRACVCACVCVSEWGSMYVSARLREYVKEGIQRGRKEEKKEDMGDLGRLLLYNRFIFILIHLDLFHTFIHLRHSSTSFSTRHEPGTNHRHEPQARTTGTNHRHEPGTNQAHAPSITVRSFGSYASTMSTKRRPIGSLGPMSGCIPIRFTWSFRSTFEGGRRTGRRRGETGENTMVK